MRVFFLKRHDAFHTFGRTVMMTCLSQPAAIMTVQDMIASAFYVYSTKIVW